MYQEVGLGVGATKREDSGPWRYLGARKSVPLGVGVPGSFVVPISVFCARKGRAMMCCGDKKGARETAVVVGLSGRGVPEVCTRARP